jgi:hypothetical protein
MASIEDDEVGLVGERGFNETMARQRVRHTMGIVDVHLAAVGLDMEFAKSAHAGVVFDPQALGRRPLSYCQDL